MTGSNTIAVTGASRGIGSAIARDLAKRGFRVACLSRKGVGVEDIELPDELGERMVAFAYDATDEASIHAALNAAAEADGLRGLVNNAGIHWVKPAIEVTAADFQSMMTTNALGSFLACREAYPHLKQSRGVIVNIGSYYGHRGARENAAYAASKAAIGALTRSLAIEWARDGIRVLEVAPGLIATDLTQQFRENERFLDYVKRSVPTGAMGQPEEVGALFAEDIGFLTGETITIDGGHGMYV
jgi:NAD(P)-dependent dehydrogenase (short-subunit alcohol dehydrogenase family)